MPTVEEAVEEYWYDGAAFLLPKGLPGERAPGRKKRRSRRTKR